MQINTSMTISRMDLAFGWGLRNNCCYAICP